MVKAHGILNYSHDRYGINGENVASNKRRPHERIMKFGSQIGDEREILNYLI